jgi:hypothetical protein
MNLQLGFESHPYSARYSASSPLTASVKSRGGRRMSLAQQMYGQGKNSGQVALELETKYQIVETFYKMEEDNLIIPLLADEYRAALDLEMELAGSGLPPIHIMTTKGIDKIETRFRRNLSGRRYDGIIRGVPTLSAQRGISHLRRNPAASRGSRPSFIDTGLYQRSFKAWEE